MKVEDVFAMYFYTAFSCLLLNSITDEKAIRQGNISIFENSQLSLMLRLFFSFNYPYPYARVHPNGASSAHES